MFTEKHGPVVLATAHLNHQPGDDRISNLRALCQKCHLAYDRTDNLQRAHETRATRKDLLRPLLTLIHLENFKQ